MKTNGVNYQLVSPHLHCRNAAKRAISIFKDHFIAVLASIDGHWPMHLWCHLLLQCTMRTLNMLCASQLNPNSQPKPSLMGYSILIGPHWHLGAQESSSKKTCPPIMGTTWHAWMVPWTIPQALLLLPSLCQQDSPCPSC
jgi:hypothetical protein